MLVLSRHCNEAIIIGHDVALVLVEIQGNKARIGVHAPLDMPVHRKEVYDAFAKESAEVVAANINATGGDAWTAEKVLLQSKSDPQLLAELQAAMNNHKGFLRGSQG